MTIICPTCGASCYRRVKFQSSMAANHRGRYQCLQCERYFGRRPIFHRRGQALDYRDTVERVVFTIQLEQAWQTLTLHKCANQPVGYQRQYLESPTAAQQLSEWPPLASTPLPTWTTLMVILFDHLMLHEWATKNGETVFSYGGPSMTLTLVLCTGDRRHWSTENGYPGNWQQFLRTMQGLVPSIEGAD